MINEKYINADTVKLDIRRYLMPNVDDDGTVTVENAERYFLNLLDNTPAADVVEVVRCKDCDHFINYNPDRTYCEEHSDGWGDNIVYVDEDDYCSFGIRKR